MKVGKEVLFFRVIAIVLASNKSKKFLSIFCVAGRAIGVPKVSKLKIAKLRSRVWVKGSVDTNFGGHSTMS